MTQSISLRFTRSLSIVISSTQCSMFNTCVALFFEIEVINCVRFELAPNIEPYKCIVGRPFLAETATFQMKILFSILTNFSLRCYFIYLLSSIVSALFSSSSNSATQSIMNYYGSMSDAFGFSYSSLKYFYLDSDFSLVFVIGSQFHAPYNLQIYR